MKNTDDATLAKIDTIETDLTLLFWTLQKQADSWPEGSIGRLRYSAAAESLQMTHSAIEHARKSIKGRE